MKKILCVAVASVMLLSGAAVFAGCGEEYSSSINWDVDLSKPIALTGLFPETGIPAFGKDDAAKIIEEATGYKMTYQELGGAADNEVDNFLSDQADFDIMKLTQAQYHPYLERGAFLDLTEILENTPQGQLLYQLIDLMDYGWESITYTDAEGNDHIYCIPDFGFVYMTDSALVWNIDHLNEIGFKEKWQKDIPEDLGEVTWALEELQKHFGANNNKYNAFCIPGSNSCEVSQIKSAFDVPWNFYVDDSGKIQQYVYSPNVDKYVNYMHDLRTKRILPEAWQADSQSSVNQKFASELCSCTYISYWNFTPLVNAMIDALYKDENGKNQKGQIAHKLGIPNTAEALKENALRWTMRIRGDGTSGSPDQEVARLEGDAGGVSYYTVIPAYKADRALYIIDYLAKKMLAFDDFYSGQEGTHWNKIQPGELGKAGPGEGNYNWTQEPVGLSAEAPKGEDYTEENDAEYAKYENTKEKILFVRPFEYSYKVYSNKDASAGNRLDKENMDVEEVTVKGGGYWCQLTPRYISQIADNSQYCNGTNSVSAKSLFHLREEGFDAWEVSDVQGIGRIHDPMWMAPPMRLWAPVSILARTLLKNGIAAAIDADDPVSSLKLTRDGAKKKKYWTEDISNEMTEWYNAVKLGK